MASQILYHLAKRYGKALFAAASTSPVRQHLYEDWARLQKIITDDPLGWRALISPLFSYDQKIQVLMALAQKLFLSPLMKDFLKTVTQRGRLKALPAIMDRFQKEMQKITGKKQGVLITATQMPAAQIQEIEKLLEEKMGYGIVLTPQVDSALLGGAILSWHGFQIDGSLVTELKILRQRLQKGI